jgi:methylamine--corrinoid protein Co-methyltransferase
LEALFNVEVACAVTGMKADKASGLVNKFLEKYEQEIEKAPSGKRFQECFDVRTGKPSPEYLRLHHEMKEELTGMGIAFS